MKNILSSSANIFFAPERTGGFGDWENKMERLEKMSNPTNNVESTKKLENKEQASQPKKSADKPQKSPEELQKERESRERQVRAQKERELHYAIDAITNIKPGFQTVGGMKKKFEKFGISLQRVLNIAIQENRKVNEILWIEIKNNPQLLDYLNVSEDAFLKENEKLEKSKLMNFLYNVTHPSKTANKDEGGNQGEIIEEKPEEIPEAQEEEGKGSTELQKFFSSRGIDIDFIKQEFRDENNPNFNSDKFLSAFDNILQGKDITNSDLNQLMVSLNAKVTKDIVYNFINNTKHSKETLQKITLQYLNVSSDIDGGTKIEETPENIAKITDTQIEEMKNASFVDPALALTYLDFQGGERKYDGELGKRLYADGEGGSFDQFVSYAVAKTSDLGRKDVHGLANTKEEYKVYLMTGYRPGSKEFEQAVQEVKTKDNFLATAKEMAGDNLRNLTSGSKVFKVEKTTSKSELMTALFSGETLEFPLHSNFSEGRSVRVAFKEGQPVLRFAGNEFDMSGNRENENFLRLFQGMADDPILMLNLEAGDKKGLEPLLRNFQHQYPTEGVGDNSNKFFRTTFKLFSEATDINWLNFQSDVDVQHFMEKMQDPRVVQNMRLELREKGLITSEGLITNESIQKAKTQNAEKKQKEQDKKDAEGALQELKQTMP